jgi:hypothetical protein
MITLILFRLRTVRHNQLEILEDQPPKIIRKIISGAAEVSLRKNARWVIGKPIEIEDNNYYFKFGKKTKETKGKYADGDFVEEEEENAKYTHVFLDGNLGLVAIAKKSNLAPETQTIATNLAKYFNKCQFAYAHNITFNINEIKDPSDFIEFIRSAYAITEFSFTYSKPNPPDTNKIIKLNEDYAEAVNGHGRNTVNGSSLNAGIIEELSKSIASTGDDAHIWAIDKPGGIKQKRQLKKDSPVVLNIEEESLEMKKSIMGIVMRTYKKIRYQEHDE